MKKFFSSAGAVLISCVVFTSIAITASAQCKNFIKEQKSLLYPFVYKKTNSTILQPGDHSELSLTFYSGRTYRIIMKSGETDANVSFTIKDSNKNLLFKSGQPEGSDYFDFTAASTEQFTIDMVLAENNQPADANALKQCVVVVVGEKE